MKKTIESCLDDHGTVFFHTKGGSMKPFIRENSTAVCVEKIKGDIKKWDVVLFKRPLKNSDGKFEYVLHRVIKLCQNGTFLICGDNTVFKEKVNRENIVGIMTGFYNGSSYTDCKTNLNYRIYVKFWNIIYSFRFFWWGINRMLEKICYGKK